MQQAQQREIPERMSWARAMIFAVGYFFIAALLIGQIPGYIYNQMTSASLQGLELGMIALAATCLAGFVVIQVIVLLFDPKPVIPPVVFSALGTVLTLCGLMIALAAGMTGNQYFTNANSSWFPLLGGKVLWFEPGAIDLVMVGLAVLFVGVAMVFYSVLATRERNNPDRRDLGTTPAIRGMIIAAIMILILFMVGYTLFNDNGLAYAISPGNPVQAQLIIDAILYIWLGAAIFLALGAFALRLHYLMRPVRKRTMSVLYIVGALGLAQTGAIFLVLWVVVYPLLALIHPWIFIGLGSYLTNCARPSVVPASCSFTQDAASIVDTIITSSFFGLLLAAIWAWKSHRNLVIISSVVTTAVIGATALLVHTAHSCGYDTANNH